MESISIVGDEPWWRRAERPRRTGGCPSPIVVVTCIHALAMKETAMTITTLSSREFNQDTSKAKKAAKEGPVFITDRGRPAHVLLTIEDYQALAGKSGSIIELLAMPGIEDAEFEPPRAGELFRPADLS